MPYYVDRTSLTVIVTAPGRDAPANADALTAEFVQQCGDGLRHGLVLTAAERHAAVSGDFAAFDRESLAPSDPGEFQRAARHNYPAELPPVGRWHYKVVPISEFMGLGTARGTADRMDQALRKVADNGWELVTTSERDSRYLGGETVLLIIRKFVVEDHLFAARFRAEEIIRRRVLRELDDEERASRPSANG